MEFEMFQISIKTFFFVDKYFSRDTLNVFWKKNSGNVFIVYPFILWHKDNYNALYNSKCLSFH